LSRVGKGLARVGEDRQMDGESGGVRGGKEAKATKQHGGGKALGVVSSDKVRRAARQ
jgi:hypothetical protein